jgi:hypothetical protein
MKPGFFYLIFFVQFIPAQLSGQVFADRNNALYLSDGVLSFDQIRGVVTAENPVLNYVSFPYVITGALFLTYRRHISKKCFLGVTAGLDNQRGDLSYGPDEGNFSSMYGISNGISGYYTRQVYTGALEIGINYYQRKKQATYGYIGAGYTFEKLEDHFYNGILEPAFFYGNSGLVPTNPYSVYVSHFNFQVTPIGYRFGGRLGGFIEFGFGYKGLFCGGAAYTL